MDVSMIGTIALVVIAVWLALSLLLGFIRGFKKSFVRLVWLAVTAVVVFFITPLIARTLNSIDISSFGLNIMGPVHHLSDIGVNMINSMNLEEAMASSPALQEFIANLPTMILNVIIFVLLFWVLKILFYPLFLFVYSRVFDKKKRQERLYKKRVKELKKKGMPLTDDEAPAPVKSSKLRLLGGLIGMACCLVVMAVTLSPVMGATAMYETVNQNVTIEKNGETVPYLSTILNENIQGYIDAYENSVARKILTYTGVDMTGNMAFGNLAVVNVGGKKIKLVDEVKSASTMYNKGLKIYSYAKDRENLTYNDIDEILSLAESMLESMDKSQAIYILGGELSNFAIDKYVAAKVNEDSYRFEFAGGDYTEVVRTVVNDLKDKNYGIRDYQDQLVALLDIASLMNNVRVTKDGNTTSLIAEVASSRMNDPKEILSFLTDGLSSFSQFSRELVGDILIIDVIDSVLPQITNSAIEAGFDALGVSGFVAKDDLSVQNIQNSLEGVIENGLKFYNIFKDSNGLAFGDSTRTHTALGSLGKIIDILRSNLLSEASYLPQDTSDTTNGLVNFLINEANNATSSFLDLSAILSSVKQITSFQQELESLSGVYSVVTTLLADEDNPLTLEALLDKDYTAINDVAQPLANVIDGNNSKIVTNRNIRELFDKLLTKLASEDSTIEEYMGITTVSGKTIKNIALDNIYNTQTGQTNIKKENNKSNWDNEIIYTLDMVRNLVAMGDFSSASSEDVTAFGESIDNALVNTKLVISNEVIRAFVEKTLTDVLADNAKLNEIMNIGTDSQTPHLTTVKSDLLSNIYNPITTGSQVTSYKDELGRIMAVLSGDFSSDMTLAQMGAKLDTMAYSQILTRSIVKKVVTHYMLSTLADQSSDIKDKITDGVNIMVANIENETLVDGTYPIVYATEFSHIDALINTITASYATDSARFSAIGARFNTILGIAGATSAPSKVMTRQALNAIIGKYIDSYVDSSTLDTSLKTIVKDMKGADNANLMNIQDYSLEMGYLIELVKVKDQTTLEGIGSVLDSVTNSQILPDTIVSVVGYYFDKEVDKLSDVSMAAALRPIKNNLPVTSYAVELKYIDDLMPILNVSGGASINFVQLGSTLDDILAPDESELILQSNINDIVTYFFTNNSNITANSGPFTTAFGMIQTKVVADTPYDAHKYETMMTEFNNITQSLSSLKGATNYGYNDFKSDTVIGSTLDTYAAMTYACDKFIAKQMANVIIGELLDVCNQMEQDYGRNDIVSAVNDILQSSEFDFANYAENDTWSSDVVDSGYYARLISAIQNALPNLS